ncbi:pyridoxamine 5'-phosphate oxidase family protein [Streptomyces sp. NPDC055078]
MTPPSAWADFQAAEPAFADLARARFESHRHHVLATLRKDGSPRVTGLEVTIRAGELWLGMMHGSRKALDLRRDARCAVHANPGGEDTMADGDIKLSGRAVEVTDPDDIARFTEAVKPPEPFHLFRVELTDVVRTYVDGDELVVQSWHPGAPAVTRRRA